jgi:hypothetical protein
MSFLTKRALSASWAVSSMVDALQAGQFLAKQRTNSGPVMESTSKHSLYPLYPYFIFLLSTIE